MSRPSASATLSFVPREHGASFMSVHALLMGTVAGVAAGGRDWAGLAVALAIGALFLPITAAVSVWSHPRLACAARQTRPGLLVSAAVVPDEVLAVQQRFQEWPAWAQRAR